MSAHALGKGGGARRHGGGEAGEGAPGSRLGRSGTEGPECGRVERGGGTGAARGRAARSHHLQPDPGRLHPGARAPRGRPVPGLSGRSAAGSGALPGDPASAPDAPQPGLRERRSAPGTLTGGGQPDGQGGRPVRGLPSGHQRGPAGGAVRLPSPPPCAGGAPDGLAARLNQPVLYRGCSQ